MSISTKLIFASIAVFCVVFVGVVLRETFLLKVERVPIEITRLPAALDGLRIVHMSDFHGRKFSENGTLMKNIVEFSPHIIVLTGDYVSSSLNDLTRISPFLQSLTTVAPTYAVSGNHDYWVGWPDITTVLRQQGVTVLENEHVVIQQGEYHLTLVGVDDPATGRDNLRMALPKNSSDSPVIVLAHAPTWFELGKIELLHDVDLVLAGHTHGGQIKIPLIGAVSNASGRLFPKNYVQGLSLEGTTWLYISRGLGYTGISLRFMSRPELTLITLKAKG